MAGDWIKIREDLKDDPAVLRMSKALGIDAWSVVGRLSDIWAWIGRHTADGSAVQVDADMIDARVQAPGFAAAMRAVGWLAGTDGALAFPEWERHNSRSAKARALEAEAKQLRRRMSDATSDTRPTKPAGSVGPEKRREEVLQSVSRASESGEAEGRPGEVPTLKQWVAECARYQVPEWYAAEKHAAFEAKGWMSGKTPLVWRSVVKNWVVRDHHNDGRPQNPPPVGAGRPNGSAPRVATSTEKKNGF